MAGPIGTDPANLENPIPTGRISPEEGGISGDHFAAPLGSATNGRLRFTRGVHRIFVRAESNVRSLCRARFGKRVPTIWVQGGVVAIRYPRGLACGWLDYRTEPPAEVALNASVPWDIEVRGGASRLLADLRGLRLGSLNLDGGASRLEVALPRPVGTVAVVVLGGASNVAISRPEGVAAQLRVSGGATNLRFDDRRIGAAGGDLDLRNRDYEDATDRYYVAVTGGANNLSIHEHQRRSGS